MAFLDSAGIGLIVGLSTRTTAVGFVVTGASPVIRRSFTTTRLDQVISFADEARAPTALPSPHPRPEGRRDQD